MLQQLEQAFFQWFSRANRDFYFPALILTVCPHHKGDMYTIKGDSYFFRAKKKKIKVIKTGGKTSVLHAQMVIFFPNV